MLREWMKIVSRPDAKPVCEAWDASYPSTWVRSGDFDVFKNPSKAEFQKLFAEHKDGLRALIQTTGDLFVWDAFAATHNDMQAHYGNTVGGYLILEPNRVLMNDLNYYHNDESETDEPETPYRTGLRAAWESIVSNPWLRRYYGDFDPIGLDNGSESDWEIFGVVDGAEKILTPDWIRQNTADA
jgi:hypothetical protein